MDVVVNGFYHQCKVVTKAKMVEEGDTWVGVDTPTSCHAKFGPHRTKTATKLGRLYALVPPSCVHP